MNDNQHFIHRHTQRLIDGKPITDKDREIYRLALAYEFERQFPNKAKK